MSEEQIKTIAVDSDSSATGNHVSVPMREIPPSPNIFKCSEARETPNTNISEARETIDTSSDTANSVGGEAPTKMTPVLDFFEYPAVERDKFVDSWSCRAYQDEEGQSVFYMPNGGSTKKDDGSLYTQRESSGSGHISYYSTQENVDDELDGALARIMSRQRSESIASLEYYRTYDSTLQMSAREELQSPVMNSVSPDRHTQQSRRLPFWLWFIIAKSLGIKLHQDDRPIVATILYTFTFMSALGFFLSNWWFTAYDIVSDYTKTTVIDGTVTIIYTVLWGALGVYANKLAFKLFSHKKFLDMLRLHSKTILKMNASVVVFVLMLLIAIFSNLNSKEDFDYRTCKTVGVEILVCKVNYVFRVMYSGFAVIWNSLVAFVVISSCRTHVIGIRRFMQALEQDARVYESRYVGMAQQINASRPVLEEYTWVDEDYLDDLRDPGVIDLDAASSIFIPHQSGSRMDEEDMAASSAPINTASPATAGSATTATTATTTTTTRSEVPITRQREVLSPSSNYGSAISSPSDYSFHAPSSVSPEREHSTKRSSVCNSLPQVRPLMSNSEILFRFWKIQSRLRMTSVALQRWMMSVICLVVIWLAMNLVQWLSFDPSLIDLINFFLPLVLLPLLSSAYAEVNQEGQRLLKFICPLEERLQLLFVLQNAPLQMTVFGFSLTYSTITTAAFGILLAFASKVLLQEMSGGGGPKM